MFSIQCCDEAITAGNGHIPSRLKRPKTITQRCSVTPSQSHSFLTACLKHFWSSHKSGCSQRGRWRPVSSLAVTSRSLTLLNRCIVCESVDPEQRYQIYIQRFFFCVLSDGDYRVDSFMGIPCFKALEASSWKKFPFTHPAGHRWQAELFFFFFFFM